MSSVFFEKCLKNGKIKEFSRGKSLVDKEVNSAESDLKWAKESLKDENYKWATIQTYYSMFHSARALLYKKGYREKSHSCLIESVRVLYVEKGELKSIHVETMQRAKVLREGADYYSEFRKESAEDLVDGAMEFLNDVKNIID